MLCGAGQAQTIVAAVGQGIKMIFDGDDSDYDSDDGVLKPGEIGTISRVCYTLVISSSDAYDDEPYLVRGPSGRTCWYKTSDVVAAAADADADVDETACDSVSAEPESE